MCSEEGLSNLEMFSEMPVVAAIKGTYAKSFNILQYGKILKKYGSNICGFNLV